MNQRQFAIVVALVTNEQGEILIAKRNEPENINAHNKWEFVGGGIDFGEDPESALIREVKEEAGVDVKITRLLPKVYSHTWKQKDREEQVIILSYECKIVSGELKANNDQEVGELKFIKPEEIGNYDCLPNVKEIIDLLYI